MRIDEYVTAGYKNAEEGKSLLETALRTLTNSISDEYGEQIYEEIKEAVLEDVFTTSAVDETHDCICFSTGDVKLAAGRSILRRMGCYV